MITNEELATDSPYLRMAIQTVLHRYMDQWKQSQRSEFKQQQLLTAMTREIIQRTQHMEQLAEQTYKKTWSSKSV